MISTTLFCFLFLFLAISISSADKFAKFNVPAALGAYKDIEDNASSNPVLVLGKTWKRFNYGDYELPAKPALGAYQDIINAVKDTNKVLGKKTFGTKCNSIAHHSWNKADMNSEAVGYACRDSSGETKFCRLMEDDKTD